jgi:hypothetical protein
LLPILYGFIGFISGAVAAVLYNIIAGIRSGMGILAEMFLKNGNPVFGVEPDPVMRAGGEYYLRDNFSFTSIPAAVEATALPDHAVKFVTAGQAFHWLDLELTQREFTRILVPGGWVVLVWNVQRAAGSPFQEALQRFWETEEFSKQATRQASEHMKRVQAYRLNFERARQELLTPFFAPGGFKEKVFENPLVVDFEALKGRILSNGPALEPGDPLFGTMLAALEEIFRAHEENGTVTIEHDTRVVFGCLW